jgi:hypothetical protein
MAGFKSMAITAVIVILFIYGFKYINKQWSIPVFGKIVEEI